MTSVLEPRPVIRILSGLLTKTMSAAIMSAAAMTSVSTSAPSGGVLRVLLEALKIIPMVHQLGCNCFK